jgi:hypothetical protein
MKHFVFLLILLFSLLLNSCGARYKIAYDYKPPATRAGMNCLSRCQQQLKQCNTGCRIQFRQCGAKAARQAKINLPGLQAAYPQQLEAWLNAKANYERELDRYEFYRFMESSRRDRYVTHCMKGGKKRGACNRIYLHDPYYSGFSYNRPRFTMPRPVKPTLASETQRLKKANCSNHCACDNRYRLCYTSCGGVVKSKKVCVKNCN